MGKSLSKPRVKVKQFILYIHLRFGMNVSGPLPNIPGTQGTDKKADCPVHRVQKTEGSKMVLKRGRENVTEGGWL